MRDADVIDMLIAELRKAAPEYPRAKLEAVKFDLHRTFGGQTGHVRKIAPASPIAPRPIKRTRSTLIGARRHESTIRADPVTLNTVWG